MYCAISRPIPNTNQNGALPKLWPLKPEEFSVFEKTSLIKAGSVTCSRLSASATAGSGSRGGAACSTAAAAVTGGLGPA